jgi:hypothetical protein
VSLANSRRPAALPFTRPDCMTIRTNKIAFQNLLGHPNKAEISKPTALRPWPGRRTYVLFAAYVIVL